MKTTPTSLLALAAAAVIGSLAGPATPALHAAEPGDRVSLQEVYRDGRAAFHRGDYETAREKFALILKHKPSHGPSRSYLSHIEQAEAARGGNPALEKRLAELVMESVELDDVTVREAVEYLTLAAEKATDGDFKPNIILKGLDEAQHARTIHLELENVPMTFVLRMVGELGGVRFDFEKFAIVGTPVSARTEDSGEGAENDEAGASSPGAAAGG